MRYIEAYAAKKLNLIGFKSKNLTTVEDNFIWFKKYTLVLNLVVVNRDLHYSGAIISCAALFQSSLQRKEIFAPFCSFYISIRLFMFMLNDKPIPLVVTIRGVLVVFFNK